MVYLKLLKFQFKFNPQRKKKKSNSNGKERKKNTPQLEGLLFGQSCILVKLIRNINLIGKENKKTPFAPLPILDSSRTGNCGAGGQAAQIFAGSRENTRHSGGFYLQL